MRRAINYTSCELPQNAADALMSCSLECPLIRPSATFSPTEKRGGEGARRKGGAEKVVFAALLELMESDRDSAL